MSVMEKSMKITKRIFMRSSIFLFMTVVGFSLLELLIFLARTQGLDLANRFPETLMVLHGVSVMTWLEVVLFWIRIALQPQVDVQAYALRAMEDSKAAAFVYLVHQLSWLARLLILLKLCDFL